MDDNKYENIPELPAVIKERYRPFETIDPSNHRYIATPNFVGYPDNHLIGYSWITEHKDENDKTWMVRHYSARQGHYDVIYCRVVDPFKIGENVVTLVDLGKNLMGSAPKGTVGVITHYDGVGEYQITFDDSRLYNSTHNNLRLATEQEVDEGFAVIDTALE